MEKTGKKFKSCDTWKFRSGISSATKQNLGRRMRESAKRNSAPENRYVILGVVLTASFVVVHQISTSIYPLLLHMRDSFAHDL